MKDTRIFLIPNLDKSGSAEYTAQIINKLDSLGFRCFADDYNRGKFEGGKTEFLPFDNVIDQMDMVITIGGDGTIIRSCKRVMPYGKPMLGINCGRLGFLADIEVNQLDLLEHLASGEYSVQPRMMLRAVVRRGGVSQSFYALNDFSVTKGEFAKLVDLEVFCNQKMIMDYRADGVIFSTPTGSTGYAMSAGGPIVDIGLDTIGLTPICPHTLFSKTILFSPSNVLEVHSKEINNSANVVFSVDGERMMNLTSQDFVEISRADKTMDFINLTHNNFCDMLNAKMLERG
jgi:NAD+ kinase